jgi:TonB-linked SusC/RagA family outer membrane protein
MAKFLLPMKITFILLVAAILQVSAHAYAQQITIAEKNAPLERVLREIRVQSGYDFLFDSKILENAKPVNLQVKNATINEALKKCLAGQALTFNIDEHTVVIKAEEQSVFKKLADISNAAEDLLIDPTTPVAGVVTNARGEAVEGATVLIKRTKNGTNTDIHGFYILKIVRPNDTLLVSYIGYKTMVIPINKQNSINVQLNETTNRLDEVVVEAYGRTTQRLTTGNIGRVTAAEIEKQPVQDPLLALEGRVAGVEITPQSGYDNGPVKVVIRGLSSINPNISSQPLYIIDGVPQTIINLNVGNITSQSGGTSPLAGYSPSDIASVEILKDADATAIYGSRGANGVVLITTKKGSPLSNEFSIDYSQGVRYTTAEWQMLNTQQYVAMRNEAFRNDGITPTVANAGDLLLWNTNSYTDWQKYSYGHTGTWANLGASLSGGDEKTTYRVAGNYNESKDITTVRGENPKASVSTNLSTHSANHRFSLSLTTDYSFLENNQVSFGASVLQAPDAPSVYNSMGALNFASYNAVGANYPFGGLLSPSIGKTYTLNSGLNLSYTLFKGFMARANVGYNNIESQQSLFLPIAAQNPDNAIVTGSATYENDHSTNFIIEPQLEYNGLISKGTINTLIGGTYQMNSSTGLQVRGYGYTNDDLLHTLSDAPTFLGSNGSAQYKYAGVFARINYNWENKYIVDLNGRRDGSSRFGEGDRYGNFGSVGAAYLISEEKWAKNFLPAAFSLVKIRGSYGTTGSDGVGDYQYLPQWGTGTQPVPTYNGVIPLTSTLQANPDFHWQVNKKLEGALDLGFINDRITLEVVYYSNSCNNQLISFPIPAITGYTTVTANSPADVRNDGWEFTVNAQILRGKHFHWSSSFNIGINSNKLVGYPNFNLSPYFTTMKIGGSLGDQYVFKYTGVNPQTGQYTYLDANHDGIITNVNGVSPGTGGDDRVAIVNTTPKFSGGMSENFNYDNLSINMFFTFRKGLGLSAFSGGQFGTFNKNVSLYQYENRWQKSGDVSEFARLTTNPLASDGDYGSSTGVYTDASFIRLQNIAIGYSLPAGLIKKLGIKRLSINVSGQNIFLITKFKGLDPEIGSFGAQPPTRTITGGLSAGF